MYNICKVETKMYYRSWLIKREITSILQSLRIEWKALVQATSISGSMSLNINLTSFKAAICESIPGFSKKVEKKTTHDYIKLIINFTPVICFLHAYLLAYTMLNLGFEKVNYIPLV